MGENYSLTNLPASFEDKVAASLTRYSMLSHGDRVGVAVSGGADSVALLHILHRAAKYELVVLHVNHALRGLESDGDEQFVRNLAAGLRLPVQVKHAPLGAGNMEQLARDARRAFWVEAIEGLHLRRIALGHNQTDQAETVLYRFLRGSGLAGLAGMAPVSDNILIRPFLGVTREEIRAWAKQQSIDWREDSSNQNVELVRNRLRLEVFNPQLVRVLAANAEVAADEETWWQAHTSRLAPQFARRTRLGLEFQAAHLRALHPAEQRRLLRYAAREVKGNLRSIDLSHVEAIRKLLETDAGHDRILIPGVDALRSFGTLLLTEPGKLGQQPRHFSVPIELGAERALPYDGGRLYVNWVKPEDQNCGNFGMEADSFQEVVSLDGDILEKSGPLDSLLVRNWEPGDEYRRAGHEKSEKIKSLFQEFRVLLWERRRWPVLVLGDQIVWARRFGAAVRFEASGESRNIVRLFYDSGAGSIPV